MLRLAIARTRNDEFSVDSAIFVRDSAISQNLIYFRYNAKIF
ncbi:hypothetical protein ACWIUD_10570 [Helicobacter sp. 23-1044]